MTVLSFSQITSYWAIGFGNSFPLSEKAFVLRRVVWLNSGREERAQLGQTLYIDSKCSFTSLVAQSEQLGHSGHLCVQVVGRGLAFLCA